MWLVVLIVLVVVLVVVVLKVLAMLGGLVLGRAKWYDGKGCDWDGTRRRMGLFDGSNLIGGYGSIRDQDD